MVAAPSMNRSGKRYASFEGGGLGGLRSGGRYPEAPEWLKELITGAGRRGPEVSPKVVAITT